MRELPDRVGRGEVPAQLLAAVVHRPPAAKLAHMADSHDELTEAFLTVVGIIFDAHEVPEEARDPILEEVLQDFRANEAEIPDPPLWLVGSVHRAVEAWEERQGRPPRSGPRQDETPEEPDDG